MIRPMQPQGTVRSRIEPVTRLDGLEVNLILEPPPAHDLLTRHVDLVVLPDSPASPAFAKLFDARRLNTSGFLRPAQLNSIHNRFAHRARNPVRLLLEPRTERRTARTIARCCSLLSFDGFDRRYRFKHALFVPSLARLAPRLVEARTADYVEAGMYVAAFARSRSVYFAGFGGGQAGFSNETIVQLAARTYVARRAMRLPAMSVFFGYFPSASRVWIDRLATRLEALEAGMHRNRHGTRRAA